MKKIFKYPLMGVVEMPKGAEILDVGMQDGELYMWVLINPDAPSVTRNFDVVGTGREVPVGKYLGTVHDRGIFVWHVFEVMGGK